LTIRQSLKQEFRKRQKNNAVANGKKNPRDGHHRDSKAPRAREPHQSPGEWYIYLYHSLPGKSRKIERNDIDETP